MTLANFFDKQIMLKIDKLGNRLSEVDSFINWNNFEKIVQKIRKNTTNKGGRPSHNNISMLKALILQKWYNLSDEQLEYQLLDRVSFKQFCNLDYNQIPDMVSIWRFREQLINNNLENQIWGELQNQILNLGFDVKEGHIQDATFITREQGKKRSIEENKLKKKGLRPDYTKKQISHIDTDAKWGAKSDKFYFGYKDHTKQDIDYNFVRSYKTTSANIHDNNIDLCEVEDISMYRDKGYSGRGLKFREVQDFTMISKGDKKGSWVRNLNKSISKIRCKGERQYSVIKKVFGGGFTRYTRIKRVSIGQMFTYFSYNLYNLFTYRSKILLK